MITVLVASFVLVISNAIMLALFARSLRRLAQAKEDAIAATMGAELQKLVNHEPCVTGGLLVEIGRVIGTQAGTSAKASLMADLSHAKRESNSLAVAEQVEAVGAVQPTLGNLLAQVGPRKAKGLLGNPLIQLLMAFMQGGGGPPVQSSSGNGDGSVADRLKKRR